ncbi:hypothetical protein BJ508DRAFT_365891 [Ascobolus immersus RN42]|uniref:Uncharacterized protein n=1 Tax=Ascobolus immersus RN42 TaxID=1160509 RepID=A0A3N4HTG7_ASCIM|nr:hypothetical protein BJ508DRAFT_365891 [Ascobolus immersus RN42]
MSRLPVTMSLAPKFRQAWEKLIATWVDGERYWHGFEPEAKLAALFDGGHRTNNWFASLSPGRTDGLNPDELRQTLNLQTYVDPLAPSAEEEYAELASQAGVFASAILELVNEPSMAGASCTLSSAPSSRYQLSSAMVEMVDYWQRTPVTTHLSLALFREVNTTFLNVDKQPEDLEQFPRLLIPVMEEYILFLHQFGIPFVGTHWDYPQHPSEAEGLARLIREQLRLRYSKKLLRQEQIELIVAVIRAGIAEMRMIITRAGSGSINEFHLAYRMLYSSLRRFFLVIRAEGIEARILRYLNAGETVNFDLVDKLGMINKKFTMFDLVLEKAKIPCGIDKTGYRDGALLARALLEDLEDDRYSGWYSTFIAGPEEKAI